MYIFNFACDKIVLGHYIGVDSIWGFTIFNSIKDIQTLIGFIVTLLIRKNIEIKPGVDKIKAIERDENGFNDKNDGK